MNLKIGAAQDASRRSFLGFGASAFATGLIGVPPSAARASALARQVPIPQAFAAPKQIKAGLLDVSYVELGPADGRPALLLHGWPYDVHSFVDVAPILAADGYRVIIPYLRGYGPTRFLSAQALRNGQPAALAQDTIDLLDALEIRQAIIAGFDWGARTAGIVAALWPERVSGLVAVSGYLISSQAAGRVPLLPEAEYQWWYQYYFATDRGAAGYAKHRREFAQLIWRTASPKWAFDVATFDRSAPAFDNPDHVDIVVHNYRWRLGLAEGERRYAELDARIAAGPTIRVPTITMEGDANGAPHPDPKSYRSKFTGPYAHRQLTGGIGHNLPQEAPSQFAQAIRDLSRL